MISMVVKVPKDTNVELLAEMITATLQSRQTDECDKKYYAEQIEFEKYLSTAKRGGDNSRTEYLIDAEYVTVELVSFIEELKEILPIETYFENHGNKLQKTCRKTVFFLSSFQSK